jgi:hypothetical protein
LLEIPACIGKGERRAFIFGSFKECEREIKGKLVS